jgi:hypothetical protein
VHHTDVVSELAGRRSIILVAWFKKRMTSQVYVSQISHVAEKSGLELWASNYGQRVVEAVLEHSMRHGRRIPGHWSGGRRRSPRALVGWLRRRTGRVVEEAVPEHWSGGRGV